MSGSNQQGMVGEPLPQPLEVIVTDPDGDPVDDVDVNFQVTMCGGTVNGATSIIVPTNSEGQASVDLTLGPEPGL